MARQNVEKKKSGKSVTRRQALRAVGVSTAAIASIPTRSLASTDDTVTITTVKAGGEPRVRKEVPAEWWAHEMKADRIRSRLETRYEIASGIGGVSLSTGDETVAGRNKSSVKVIVDSDGYSVSIPNHIDGIPIAIEESTEPSLTYSCSDDTDAEDYVPGGVGLSTDAAIEEDFSTTCEVTYSGTHYLMTCYHGVSDSCPNSSDGTTVFQAGQDAGDVARQNANQDWVIVKKTPDADISGYSHYIENDTAPICGHVTRDGLFDLKGAGTTIYQQGITTCKTEHQVRDIDYSYSNPGCVYNNDRLVRVTNKVDNGDSGGPIFHQYYYDGSYRNALVAPTTAVDSSPDVTFGTAAYWIHSDQLIDFNPHGCSTKY